MWGCTAGLAMDPSLTCPPNHPPNHHHHPPPALPADSRRKKSAGNNASIMPRAVDPQRARTKERMTRELGELGLDAGELRANVRVKVRAKVGAL